MVVESIILIVAIILAVLVFLRFIPLNLWISALASGVHVSIFTLMGMRIRRVPPAKIVGPLIKAEKAGLNMQISKMEAHFLAGGNLDRVITALITARGANIKLDFPEACAIDLAGRDVLQAVQMSVNPKVIETPVVAAIAKDGIELRAKARVTVRANIERLVGGAGVEVEPVDQAFCLVETREYVLIRFVALRGLVEEILAGSHQRDCKAATEQI